MRGGSTPRSIESDIFIPVLNIQVSYDANRYLLPHSVVGKRVLLKVTQGEVVRTPNRIALISIL